MTDPETVDVGRLADEIRDADPFEALAKSRELANAADELRARRADESRSAHSRPSELLIENIGMIDRIVASMGRRSGMGVDDVEEFAASVKLRLIDDDYRMIRAYEGRSQFSTYIAAVVRRLLIDYRRAHHRLHGAAADQTEVGVDPDDSRSERASAAVRITEIVNTYIDRLPEEDQLLFRLRFMAEMNTAQIARSLHLNQQTLYRRLQRHFRELRNELERAGIAPSDVSDLMGTESELNFHLGDRGEPIRPSTENTADDADDLKKQ